MSGGRAIKYQLPQIAIANLGGRLDAGRWVIKRICIQFHNKIRLIKFMLF